MKTVYGDIFEELRLDRADVLIHGCNCFCNMGAGIALDIKNRFPKALAADLDTELGSNEKLGTYSKAIVNNRNLVIINAYTQFNWKGHGVLADYNAIRKVFRAIKEEFKGRRIIYPLIGSGLAKGDWNIIKNIIDEELHGEYHYCVRLSDAQKKPI